MNITLTPFDSVDQNTKLWEEILESADNASFMTTLPWATFKKELGVERELFFLHTEILGEKIPVGVMYIELHKRRISKYAYAPYGPLLTTRFINKHFEVTDKKAFVLDVYSDLISQVKSYAKANGCNVFRMDPLLDESYREELLNIGFKRSLAPTQAFDTWEMSLEPFETHEALLMAFKKDTRYYVNRASNLGVKIERATTKDHITKLGELMQELTYRKGFATQTTEYFFKQWELLQPKGMTEVFLAKYKNKFIAGALINFYRNRAYYSFGASTSDPELQKLSAPYLLQYEIMKHCMNKGYGLYNFWGVVPKGINHYGQGFSKFKRKFPGKLVSYVGPLEAGSGLDFVKQRIVDRIQYRKERYW